MTTVETPVDNGVNVGALLGVRSALTESPEIAQFRWRTMVSWVNGTHSQAHVDTFYGFGQEQRHRTGFTYDVDHPLAFAAEDNGATPVELVLASLASCFTAGVATVASYRGIQLRSVTAELEGDMDLRGIMGVDPDIRNGYQGIRVRFSIDADATREELEAVVAQSQKRSAVFDIVTNPTAVTVGLA